MAKAKMRFEEKTSKRTYVRQTEVPAAALDEALRIPGAILDNLGNVPATPLQAAKALSIDPKGSQFRVLTGAAIAFGLIEGGAQATTITVTDLARRILRPKLEGDDLNAKREAVLRPRVFNEFLRRYDGNAFPRTDIALNVLEEYGVPRSKVEEILERLDASARSVGFLEEIKGKYYVTLLGTATSDASDKKVANAEHPCDDPHPISEDNKERVRVPPPPVSPRGATLAAAIEDDQRRRRVFITHGSNRELVTPIKKLLEYGELEPVISVERQTVSKPVPEKVMDDMRSCGAAIIHVDVEKVIVATDGTEHSIINSNVLIEIGAAMAFYGRRFILLVREGISLPSNLQGLYEVRYSGATFDATATIKLLEAIKDIKNYELPGTRQHPESTK